MDLKKLITLLSVVLLFSCTPNYDLEKDYCGGLIVEVERNNFSYTGYEFTVLLDSTYYKIDLPEHYHQRYGIGDRLCEESWREKTRKQIEKEELEYQKLLEKYGSK